MLSIWLQLQTLTKRLAAINDAIARKVCPVLGKDGNKRWQSSCIPCAYAYVQLFVHACAAAVDHTANSSIATWVKLRNVAGLTMR